MARLSVVINGEKNTLPLTDKGLRIGRALEALAVDTREDLLYMRQVFAAMERKGRIPRAESEGWEDHLIAWQTQQAQGTGQASTNV